MRTTVFLLTGLLLAAGASVPSVAQDVRDSVEARAATTELRELHLQRASQLETWQALVAY